MEPNRFVASNLHDLQEIVNDFVDELLERGVTSWSQSYCPAELGFGWECVVEVDS